MSCRPSNLIPSSGHEEIEHGTLKFFRPSKDTVYQHIDSLFDEPVNWEPLETHWQDLMRVVLSIKAGKVLPSMLLRKLGNNSRKNRLYRAFRELGRVVRTVLLLQYISDIELRRRIGATTNKVEAYNGFSKWSFFGGEGVIAENDPEEQEKRIKYKDLVANIMIFQNVVDMTRVIRELQGEGYEISRDDLAALSPYPDPSHQTVWGLLFRPGERSSTAGKRSLSAYCVSWMGFIQLTSYFGAYIGCTRL